MYRDARLFVASNKKEEGLHILLVLSRKPAYNYWAYRGWPITGGSGQLQGQTNHTPNN